MQCAMSISAVPCMLTKTRMFGFRSGSCSNIPLFMRQEIVNHFITYQRSCVSCEKCCKINSNSNLNTVETHSFSNDLITGIQRSLPLLVF